MELELARMGEEERRVEGVEESRAGIVFPLDTAQNKDCC